MVHAIRPSLVRIARVLYADALPVIMPVACMPGYVLVVHALGYVTSPADDVVCGDVRPGVLKPAYGAPVGALRNVDDYVVYCGCPSIGVGVVTAVGWPPDRSAVIGAALSGVEELWHLHVLGR